jgi:hypothetical protein
VIVRVYDVTQDITRSLVYLETSTALVLLICVSATPWMDDNALIAAHVCDAVFNATFPLDHRLNAIQAVTLHIADRFRAGAIGTNDGGLYFRHTRFNV